MASIDAVRALERADLRSAAPDSQMPQLLVTLDTSVGAAVGGDAAAEVALPPEFREPMAHITKLRAFVGDGEMLTAMLYCFRSCVPAIPQARGDSSVEAKKAVYKDTFRVLQPEIEKLNTLKKYCEGLVVAVPEALDYLKAKIKAGEALPMEVVETVLRLFDLALQIDTITDMKTSIMNTFTCYMKALKQVTSDVPDGEALLEKCQELRLFLKANLIKGSARYQRAMDKATSSAGASGEADTVHLLLFLANPLEIDMRVFRTFRDELKERAGHEVLLVLLRRAVDMYKGGWFVSGDQKHSLLRAMAMTVMLMDDKVADAKKARVASVFQNADVRKTKVFSVLKEYPVLPMFPDMPVLMERLMRSTLSFTPDLWAGLVGDDDSRRAYMAKHYDLSAHWRSMRNEFRQYSVVFTRILDEVTSLVADGKGAASTLSEMPPVVVQEAMDQALVGLRLLGAWQARVAEQTAWKMIVVRPKRECVAMGGQPDRPGFGYEQAVRFNYSAEQRSVMVDCVAMIKSLAALMCRGVATLAPLFRVGMHAEVQDYVHDLCTRLLVRSHKKSRAAADQFIAIRRIAAEWPSGSHEDEYKSARGSDIPRQNVNRRVCPPTAAQLTALRIGTEAIADPQSAANKVKTGIFTRLVTANKLQRFQYFDVRLYMYPWLEDFGESIRACSFLGDMWYRERFLAMAHCVQFPIESSLPWTLTEHAITCNAPPTLQSLLYLLDIYNDAAHAAVYQYRQQFLFDEVEAEVNLVFDQFIFLLSDAIFQYARDQASALQLDTQFRDMYERGTTSGSLSRPARRFEVQLLQRNLRLLGRSIDVCNVLGVTLNATLRQHLESAVTRFEGDGITSIVELQQHLAMYEEVHRQLSNEGVSLDPWAMMLSEVTDAVHPSHPMSRVALGVILHLASDLVPNFIYNDTTQRFVISPTSQADPTHAATLQERKNVRKKHPMVGKAFKTAYGIVQRPLRDYFGMEHCEALVQVLGPGAVAVVVDEIVTQMVLKIKEEFAVLVPHLLNGFPPIDRLPQFQYRLGACYWYFLRKMVMLFKYDDLKPCVFQPLREIGNALAFVRMLDHAQRRLHIRTRTMVVPFAMGTADAASGAGGAAGAIRTALGGVAASTPPSDVSAASPGAPAAVTAAGRPIKSALAIMSLQASVGRLSNLCKSYNRPPSLFSAALQRLFKALDEPGEDGVSLRQAWSVVPGSKRDESTMVINVERTPDLWRLWSALLFLYCVPQVRGDEDDPSEVDTSVPDDVEEFGDGFLLAGTALLHLLRQRLRFQAADFTSHLLRCSRYEDARGNDAASASVGAVSAAVQSAAYEFINTAGPAWDRMQQMFAAVESAFDNAGGGDHYQRLQFVPPADDSDIAGYASVAKDKGGASHAPPPAAPRVQARAPAPAPLSDADLTPAVASADSTGVESDDESEYGGGAGAGGDAGAGAGGAGAGTDVSDDEGEADDGSAATSPEDDPEYAPFFKMLHVGVPLQNVQNKMRRQGLDPSVLERGRGGEPEAHVMTVAEDPELAPFFKMLRVGVPKQSVMNKMRRAGYDEALIDTPDAPSPNA